MHAFHSSLLCYILVTIVSWPYLTLDHITLWHPQCAPCSKRQSALHRRQIYFKMSDIQNSIRRVVLIHTDEVQLERIMESARRLKLLDKKRHWFLMDGVIGHKLASSAFASRLGLPAGLMALHQTQVPQNTLLYAIINLLRDLASNASTAQSEPQVSCADSSVSPIRRDLAHRLYR